MTPQYSERAQHIAAGARLHHPEERLGFIRAAAGGDPDVEAQALDLLRRADSSDTVSEPLYTPSAALTPGSLLMGRYMIIRELNRGGFGVVYLAHDQQLHGKPVVIKLQLQTLGDDPWFERKFKEEIRALALIDHPGVVGALDSGKTPEGRPFLVMQYVQGRSLRAAMTPEGMPLDRTAHIIRQIGQALSAAHDKGIWHRDLKPENIMLQPLPGGEEHVRLIDFGIATIADLQATQRRSSTRVAGSFSYMAPEQVEGQPSAATDLYACGVIAYEMVTGRKPFVPEDVFQLAALQRAGVRIKPSDLRPGLSSTSQKIILQALSYNPKDRPTSAREFGEQLAQALLAGPSGSSSGTHPGPSGKRQSWIAGVAVAVVIAALGGGVWLLRPGAPASKANEVASSGVLKTSPAERDNLAVELEFWNSIKSENRPELYREYLSKYPHGQFAQIAQIRLDEAARPKTPAPADKPKTTEPAPAAIKLAPPRPTLNPDEYNGPLRGALHWSGKLSPGATLIIQAGRASNGSLSGDVPRVPIDVETPPGSALAESPSEQNNWDRLVLRNDSGKNMDSIAIRWKIGK